jgi:hypothetical protein
MAEVRETFEGGTNGAAVTTSNTIFDAIVAGFTFDNSWKAHGNLSVKLDATTGTGRYLRKNISGTAISLSVHINLAGASAADERLVVLTDSGGTTIAYLVANGSGKLRIGCTGNSAVWTANNAYATNTNIRVDLYVVAGSTTSNGIMKVGVFNGDSSSPISGESISTYTNLNIGGGGATFGQLRVGKCSGTLAANAWFDDVRWDLAAGDLLGPVANTPPTVSLTGNQNLAAAVTATVAVTAADTDGTIASYAAAVDTANSTHNPTLTGATTSSVSFTTPSAPALVTIAETVTDNGGATASATTEVRVPVSGSTDTKPINVTPITTGSWSNVGGAANAAAALGDASDATYLQSDPLTTTPQLYRTRTGPSTARGTVTVTVRMWVDVGTANAAVKVYEGTTLRASFTQGIDATPTDYPFPLSDPQVASVSDWGAVWVQVEGSV